VDLLRSDPFGIEWGSEIIAQVSAINKYGESLISLPGGGAVIITTPIAPTGISYISSELAAGKIGL
jgi:hypothetical protein